MANRKQVAITETSASSPNQKNDYVELKMPKLPRIPKPTLFFVLITAITFFAGYQTAKVTYWEQKEKTLAAAIAEGGAGKPTPTPSFYKVSKGHLPVLGKKNAKVTIIEFSDLQCLFCRKFWRDTFPELKKNYIYKGLVSFAYRHYPLPAELHPAARSSAEAAECANDQNKFWDYHNRIFEEQIKKGEGTIEITDNDLISWAQDLGLDMNLFSDCFINKKNTQKIDADMSEAQKVNAASTPTFYINGQILVGAQPYQAFKTIIDEQLKK